MGSSDFESMILLISYQNICKQSMVWTITDLSLSRAKDFFLLFCYSFLIISVYLLVSCLVFVLSRHCFEECKNH